MVGNNEKKHSQEQSSWEYRGYRYVRVRNASLLGNIRARLGQEFAEPQKDNFAALLQEGRNFIMNMGIEKGLSSQEGVHVAIGAGLLVRAIKRFGIEYKEPAHDSSLHEP